MPNDLDNDFDDAENGNDVDPHDLDDFGDQTDGELVGLSKCQVPIVKIMTMHA